MIDLHTHTDESDGTLTPTELVRAARDAGLQTLAITDHDTLTGYDLAREAAQHSGLELIPAVELTTVLPLDGCTRNAHVLAYFPVSPPSPRFRDWLIAMQEGRRERNQQMVVRLRELGLDVSLQEAESLGRALTGRPHFARLLIHKGYATDFRDAFARYLGEQASAYVPRLRPSMTEALAEIHASRGVAVLAHPARLDLGTDGDESSLIRSLSARGLDGLEVFHTDHSPADQQRYQALARQLDLVMTGGSDFHGEAKPEAELGGVAIPGDVLGPLRDRAGI